jgi:hypothetical protein
MTGAATAPAGIAIMRASVFDRRGLSEKQT